MIVHEQIRFFTGNQWVALSPAVLVLIRSSRSFQDATKEFRAFTLKVSGELFVVNSGLRERRDHFFGVAAIDRQNVAHRSMIGERKQRLFGNCVDCVRCSEGLHIKDIRRFGVFSAGACPEQTLRLRT